MQNRKSKVLNHAGTVSLTRPLNKPILNMIPVSTKDLLTRYGHHAVDSK